MPDGEGKVLNEEKESSVEKMRQKEKSFKFNVNPELKRLTVNSEGVRYLIQNVSNYGLRDFPKIIETLGKEEMHLVLLNLP